MIHTLEPMFVGHSLAQLTDSLFRDFPQQTSSNISWNRFLIAEKNRESIDLVQYALDHQWRMFGFYTQGPKETGG